MDTTALPSFAPGMIIEILGNVASGKTTTAKTIAQISNFHYVDIDIYAQNPFLEDYVRDPKRWTFTSDLFFSNERAKQIPLVTQAIKQHPVVLDSGFHMGIFAYAKNCLLEGKISQQEWELLRDVHFRLMRGAPQLYASVFIDVPLDELQRRIKERGRPHEQSYSRAYLEGLQSRLNEHKEELIAKKERAVVATFHELEDRVEFHGGPDKNLEALLLSLPHPNGQE